MKDLAEAMTRAILDVTELMTRSTTKLPHQKCTVCYVISFPQIQTMRKIGKKKSRHSNIPLTAKLQATLQHTSYPGNELQAQEH